MPRQHAGRQRTQQIAKRTWLYLILVMLFLAALALALIFKAGQAVWPAWLVAHRTQSIGAVLLGLLVTMLLSPIIVQVNSNPRHLSGPGHNPDQGSGPWKLP